jgi:hypothetical protein
MISNRAPSPSAPVSLTAIPVMESISLTRNRPRPVFLPKPRSKILSLSGAGMPVPLSCQTMARPPSDSSAVTVISVTLPPWRTELSSRSHSFGQIAGGVFHRCKAGRHHQVRSGLIEGGASQYGDGRQQGAASRRHSPGTQGIRDNLINRLFGALENSFSYERRKEPVESDPW